MHLEETARTLGATSAAPQKEETKAIAEQRSVAAMGCDWWKGEGKKRRKDGVGIGNRISLLRAVFELVHVWSIRFNLVSLSESREEKVNNRYSEGIVDHRSQDARVRFRLPHLWCCVALEHIRELT